MILMKHIVIFSLSWVIHVPIISVTDPPTSCTGYIGGPHPFDCSLWYGCTLNEFNKEPTSCSEYTYFDPVKGHCDVLLNLGGDTCAHNISRHEPLESTYNIERSRRVACCCQQPSVARPLYGFCDNVN